MRPAQALAALALLLAGTVGQPAAAQRVAPQAAVTALDAAAVLERVVLDTELGPITLDLDRTHAPVTTANFLRYVEKGRLNGTAFYRAMRLDWGTQPNGLIQGGTQADPKRNFPPIAHEPTNETGLRHKVGTISMARYEPGTATGDFSIMLSPQPGLDAQPDATDPSTKAGFAAFGQVVEGMDVVRAIFDAPVSATKGEGFMRGQMIEKPVRILKAQRVPRPAETPGTAPAANGAPLRTP